MADAPDIDLYADDLGDDFQGVSVFTDFHRQIRVRRLERAGVGQVPAATQLSTRLGSSE